VDEAAKPSERTGSHRLQASWIVFCALPARHFDDGGRAIQELTLTRRTVRDGRKSDW
jgi:hypothetical protein